MKIVTWNINGLRATKSPLKQVLEELDCDIICIQETKVTKDQLESSVAIIEGFNSYFSFSQVRQGYSGVATFCRENVVPVRAQEGLFDTFEKNCGEDFIGKYGDLKLMFTDERARQLDKEGRTVITQFEFFNEKKEIEKLTIINVYCPRADPDNLVRVEFKMDFYRALSERAKAILKSGSHVVICGDVNTSHRQIDHCDPDDPEVFNDSPFREWIDQLLYNKADYSESITSQSSDGNEPRKCGSPYNSINQSTAKSSTVDKELETETTLPETKQQYCIEVTSPQSSSNTASSGGYFVDTFRYFFPDRSDAFTCWSTMKGCRQTNYGTRIDYIFVSHNFHSKYVKFCDIHPEIEGSDHCPVKAELEISMKSATKCPSCCTKYYPEFGGRQQKLSSFFMKKPLNQKFSETFSPRKRSSVNPKSKVVSLKRKAANDKTAESGKQSKLTFFVKPDNEGAQKPVSSKQLFLENPQKRGNLTINTAFSKKNKTVGATKASVFWKSVLKGPDPPPHCSGHDEPSLLRTVKKEGPNLGRQFYVCCRPEGHKNNPDARCSFFQWKETRKVSLK